MDELNEITKRDSAQGWILHNALTDPDQLEFKVDPLEAADMDVNMIGVGTHGRGAIYQLLVGSVSEEIIHKSRYPFLVIPTRKRSWTGNGVRTIILMSHSIVR